MRKSKAIEPTETAAKDGWPEISDEALTTADVPGPRASWARICKFALTLNGYKVTGSFDGAADIANARNARSLRDLRISLFFEQRRWHHFGEAPDSESMEYIRGLVSRIREKVAKRKKFLH